MDVIPTEEEERKEQLKHFFQHQFNELLCMGVPRNTAAAEALLDCRHCSDARLRVDPAEIVTVCGISALFAEAAQSGSYSQVFRLIGKVMNNTTAVSNSFLLERTEPTPSAISRQGLTSARGGIPVDLMKLDYVHQKISTCEHEGVKNSIVYALEALSNDIRFRASSATDGPSLVPFIVILETPGVHDVRYLETMRNLVFSLNVLPNPSKLRLLEYICNVSVERYTNHVNLLLQYIAGRVNKGAFEEAKLAVAVLSIWYACIALFPSVPASTFFSQAINEQYASTRHGKSIEYRQWLSDLELTHGRDSGMPPRPPGRAGAALVRLPSALYSLSVPVVFKHPTPEGLPVAAIVSKETSSTPHGHASVKMPLCCRHKFESLISYPFILSAGVKAAILEIDAARQMREGTESEMQQAVATGSRYVIPYLVIRVRRSHLVEDAINQFAAQDDGSFDLKKPLKVVFDGEDGIDEGGVRKEFYQIVTKQLLDPGFGMFKHYEESRCLWFNSDSLESSQGFELIGTLVGVAIYNSVIIDLNMPRVVYKKMKGKEAPTLEDLASLQPSLAAGLQKLLDHTESSPGEIESVYDLRFEISYEVFGEMRTVELLPGGGDIRVSASNREMYVDLYVEYLLDKSIESQFNAFAKGFHKVCGGDALDLFEASELELLICGNPMLDFAELEKGTVYDDGYDREARVIMDLWAVLHQFDEADKKKFLKFLTGSDRSPIDGLSKLRFVISRNGDEDTRLPSAHTCFNHMLLPEYSSREVLEKNLRFAISESEGFALR